MRSKPVRVKDWSGFARSFLKDAPKKRAEASPEDIRLEIQVLLAHALEKNRAWVLAHPEAILTPQQQRRLTGLLAGLAQGTPLPYLTGHQEFFGLDFVVTPEVLIPRPETELLVERALSWLKKHPTRRLAADAGTGSGCIAVSLAHSVPDLRVLAVDCSWGALQIARRNIFRHQVDRRIGCVQGNLLEAVQGPLDLVCANLPYIPHAALAGLPVARYEPHLALDGGQDGLESIRALLADAPRWLAPGGLLLLEMQFDQGEEISALARNAFPDAQIAVIPDLAGLPRLVEIERT